MDRVGTTVCSHGTPTDKHCVLCCDKKDCKQCDAKIKTVS